MKMKIFTLIIALLIVASAMAQNQVEDKFFTIKRSPEPFLFSTTTLTPEDLKWSLDYSGSYGQRVSGPFGYDGVGQQFAVKGYLGNRFTCYASTSLGFSAGENVLSAQRAEIIRDFIGGKKSYGLRVGLGMGVGRDYYNVISMLSRATLSFDAPRWKAGGNLLFEKALARNRDQIDVISSVGFHYNLLGRLYGGFEAVGEDLEGFWDKEEAEGGAKLLIGPSLNMTTNNSRISFSVSGGPVFYATRSPLTNPVAMRDLPSQPGFSLRARVIFNLFGS
jgi:hypothetical protein